MITALKKLKRRIRPLTEIRNDGQLVGYYCDTCDWTLKPDRKRRENDGPCSLCGRGSR